MSDKLILVHYEGGYRGIFAREDISEGETLVKAGSNAMISSQQALLRFPVIYYLRNAWANDRNDHLNDNLTLTLFLLLSEMFHPTTYTHSLPKIEAYKLNFPVFWTEEMLRLMPHSFQKETLNRQKADNQLFEKLVKFWPDAQWGKLKKDDLLLALYRMNTRIAGLGIKGKHIKSVLLPVFDLINHGKQKNVDLEAKWLPSGELGYHVLALRNIKKGEELYVHYGQLSDFSLLQKYGFTLNSVNITSSTPKAYLSFNQVQMAINQVSKNKISVLERLWPNYSNGVSETKLTVSMEKGKVVIVDELTAIIQNVSKSVKTQMLLMSKILKTKLKSIKHDFNHERLRANTGD